MPGAAREHRQLRRFANFAAFQTVWLLSLVGAGSGFPWLGPAALLLFMAGHFPGAAAPRADALLVLTAAAAGLCCDTLYIRAGLLAYAAPLPSPALAPFWIVAMWMNFGMTLNESLAWLKDRLLLGALLGAVGGPLAYLAGIRLQAARMTAEPWLVLVVIGLSWAIAVVLLLLAARSFGRRPGRSARCIMLCGR